MASIEKLIHRLGWLSIPRWRNKVHFQRKSLVFYPCRHYDGVHHKLWDNVVWSEEQMQDAQKKVEANSSEFMNQEQQEKLQKEADNQWDGFYSQHQNRFFKDRHWLFTEFPELAKTSATTSQDEPVQTAPDAKPTILNSDPSSEESVSPLRNSESVAKENEGAASSSGAKANCEPVPLSQIACRSTKEGVIQDSQNGVNGVDCSVNERTCGDPTNPLDVANSERFPGWDARTRILEVGCGVGNTIFPILQSNIDPGLFVYGCDFSSVAIDIVKQHPDFNPQRCHAFVYDVTDSDAALPFPEGSLDTIILIFVLSAIHPEKMQKSINKLARCLKPGGLILLRDYGRYDLAQLRFKKGRCLSDHFYARGDGTLVYFFTQDELRTLFTKAGLHEVQNIVDHRLQVNRGRQLTMYRVWMQCKYRKPLSTSQLADVDKS
ncbi:tRNA N(3)-cytidine methyltransferase METTL2-like isoform X1 [Asterias amurensis]|uniref:tRNA N(3)-cytidine methyltransferase METTL2-like isoform X1 n=1 Tax=Asterias amurensis TaxID=7602 RepID=UPI003AB1A7AF